VKPWKYLQQSVRVSLIRLAGFAVVYRNRMRARCAARDLLIGVTLTGLVISAGYVQTLGIGTLSRTIWSSNNAADLLTHWAIGAITVTGVLAAVLASILGAVSMPSVGEFESVQSSLLTRLKPIDICAGRLLAGIRIPGTMVLSSAAFWLGANLVAVRYGTQPQYGPVVGAHITILLFSFALGGIAYLCSIKRRPGSNPVAGVCAALALGAICVSATWLVNPVIVRMDSPSRLIETTLLINPAVCIASAYQVDILREEWLYNHLQAQDYPFYYPSVSASCVLYLAAGCSAMGLSAVCLRRAYI
jgi:hypothetical protein